ncbi:hypothetical protein LEP1GSC133_3970 [Leptospira borgpetersenii serovar Pomona str. 200901868]|uniref:Uncharacterized protein n=1 Tax=Leptospira borgpetersenii serovar Pomona str. 200901868 TaxID=1192866 RepID=M6WGV2_LEPBO|nr:hypothetical protein LEP1GSC133_3970 [Leptospira borgpetersenii serovar Pomona str. 200901868]
MKIHDDISIKVLRQVPKKIRFNRCNFSESRSFYYSNLKRYQLLA